MKSDRLFAVAVLLLVGCSGDVVGSAGPTTAASTASLDVVTSTVADGPVDPAQLRAGIETAMTGVTSLTGSLSTEIDGLPRAATFEQALVDGQPTAIALAFSMGQRSGTFRWADGRLFLAFEGADPQGEVVEEPTDVLVYLTGAQSAKDPSCRQDLCTTLLADLRATPEVATAYFESQQQALQRYRATFADQPEMLDIVSAEALPASFHLKMTDPKESPMIVEDFAGRAGVDSVQDIASNPLSALMRPSNLGRFAEVVVGEESLAVYADEFQQSVEASAFGRYTSQLAIAGSVTAGPEQVDGVPATRYSCTLDLTGEAVAGLDPSLRATFEQLVSDGVTQIPLDLWLDSDGRLIRVVQDFTTAEGPQRTELDLGGFGAPVDITVPAASEMVGG